MKDQLTEAEKKELKKLLEDHDKSQDVSWLMVDYYYKLSKKQNPYNLKCKLCTITHLAQKCPNTIFQKEEEKTKENTESYAASYYNW